MQQRAVGELWVAVETDRIKTRKTLPPLQGQRHGFPRLSRLGPIEAVTYRSLPRGHTLFPRLSRLGPIEALGQTH